MQIPMQLFLLLYKKALLASCVKPCNPLVSFLGEKEVNRDTNELCNRKIKGSKRTAAG